MKNLSDDVNWLITSLQNVMSYNNTTNYNNQETDYDETDREVTAWMNSLLPPFLFTLGLISNTLVILVMRSKYFRLSSTAFYMIVTACTDSLCLLLALPPHYVYVNHPTIFKAIRGKHWICSLFNVLGWGTSDLGIYFTVAMTIERAIGVWKPMKSSKYCTKRRAKIAVVCLIFFEIVKLCPIAIKSRVVDSDMEGQLCDIDRTDISFVYFYNMVWSWFHVFILGVCYILAMGGNFVIVFYVKKSSSKRHLYSGGRFERVTELRKISQNKQISIMLIIDSATLIICTLPFAIVNLLSSKWRILLNSDGGKNLVFTLSFYLLYVNRCINLFLYCVSGERFRKAMRTVVCGCILKKSQPPVCRLHGITSRCMQTGQVSRCLISTNSFDNRFLRTSREEEIYSTINLTTFLNHAHSLRSKVTRNKPKLPDQEAEVELSFSTNSNVAVYSHESHTSTSCRNLPRLPDPETETEVEICLSVKPTDNVHCHDAQMSSTDLRKQPTSSDREFAPIKM